MDIPKFGIPATAAFASLIAGPAFFTALQLVEGNRQMPAPSEIGEADILAFLQFMPSVSVLGALIAFVPNLVGTLVMSRWSSQSWVARTPVAWIVAGGAFGAMIIYVLMSGHTGGLTPAFVLTGGLCAAVCRLFVDLGHEEAA
jgi:hypothetical protein